MLKSSFYQQGYFATAVALLLLLPLNISAQNGLSYEERRQNLIKEEQAILKKISLEVPAYSDSIGAESSSDDLSDPRAGLNLERIFSDSRGTTGRAQLDSGSVEKQISEHEVQVAKEVISYEKLSREMDQLDHLSSSTLQDIYSLRSQVILLEEKIKDLGQSDLVIRITEEKQAERANPGYRGHPLNKVADLPAYKVNFDLPRRSPWSGPGEGANFGDKEIPPSQAIAYVTSVKPLYAGPRTDRLILGEIQNGTRVAITDILENWYRIITEDGTRGWITGLHLSFGERYHQEPGQSVRIAAYSPESDRTDWNPAKEFVEN